MINRILRNLLPGIRTVAVSGSSKSPGEGLLWAICATHLGACPGRPDHTQGCDADEAERAL